jgi:tetratricopeptide (TPR) repeat protein
MRLKRQLKKILSTVRNNFSLGIILFVTLSWSTASFSVELVHSEHVSQELKPLVDRLHKEKKRNEVLNLLEISVAAIQKSDLQTAEVAIDSALIEISTVYANNENAAKARSLWHKEGSKNYKGEPYERAMAHYYRGILDIYKGNYDNAQAAFETGLQQDAFAEEEQNSADIALLAFLRGWSFQQAGNLNKAKESYEEVAQLRPQTQLPLSNHNTLIIVETGKSPRKISDGVGHYELLYRRGKKIKQEFAVVNGESPKIVESLYYQASTRGGRPVDSIIQGKVSFKSKTVKTGEVLSKVGQIGVHASALSASSSLQNVGLGIAAVGLISTLASANAKAEADTRYWSNLPDKVHLFTTYLDYSTKSKNQNVDVVIQDKKGLVIHEQSLLVTKIRNNSGLAWVKTNSAYETMKGER